MGVGQPPLLGVLAGSVTLTGGPATGLAFAPLFEAEGIQGAATVAVMAAMVGIVCGGLIGSPIATMLIERGRIPVPGRRPTTSRVEPATRIVESRVPEPAATTPSGEDPEAFLILKHLVLMLAAMWLGGFVSRALTGAGFTLPSYIGAMLVAAALRNADDLLGVFGLSQQTLDDLGTVALSLFLAMALMTLRLWELANLAVPLTIILVAQVALVALVSALVVPCADGARLRKRGDGGRLRRIHAGDDRERDGEHERARGAVRPCAEGIPDGAARRRVLHRLRQRDADHRLPEPS